MLEAGPVLYSDRAIKCTDCGAEFSFSAGEQQFYEERGFRFPPRRCKECRLKKRDTPGNAGSRAVRTDGSTHAGGEQKETWPATCTNCGATTTVPFKPDPQRPTFCRKCYAERRSATKGR